MGTGEAVGGLWGGLVIAKLIPSKANYLTSADQATLDWRVRDSISERAETVIK